MTKKEVLIADVPGTRLDQFVALKLGRYSRGHVQDLIANGLITVDGKRRPADYRLKDGERVEVRASRTVWADESEFESWVLHEDRWLIVLNKPAGLLMHPLGASWLGAPRRRWPRPNPTLPASFKRSVPTSLRRGPSAAASSIAWTGRRAGCC